MLFVKILKTVIAVKLTAKEISLFMTNDITHYFTLLGLDMLASVMPSSVAPASGSEYSLAEPLFSKPEKIPGLETPSDEKPPNPILPILSNINVNDLFAKLVATGIVQVNNDVKTESKEESKVEEKPKPKEDKNMIHKVDFMKPETLRV